MRWTVSSVCCMGFGMELLEVEAVIWSEIPTSDILFWRCIRSQKGLGLENKLDSGPICQGCLTSEMSLWTCIDAISSAVLLTAELTEDKTSEGPIFALGLGRMKCRPTSSASVGGTLHSSAAAASMSSSGSLNKVESSGSTCSQMLHASDGEPSRVSAFGSEAPAEKELLSQRPLKPLCSTTISAKLWPSSPSYDIDSGVCCEECQLHTTDDNQLLHSRSNKHPQRAQAVAHQPQRLVQPAELDRQGPQARPTEMPVLARSQPREIWCRNSKDLQFVVHPYTPVCRKECKW